MQKRVDAEAARIEAERERIRQEEERKAQAAAEAKAEAERARIRAEEQEKARREAEAQAAQREQERQAELARAVLLQRQEAVAPGAVPTLGIGAINERLRDFKVSEDGLRAMGFEPGGRNRAAPLYFENQFPAICAAIAHRADAAAAAHVQRLAA